MSPISPTLLRAAEAIANARYSRAAGCTMKVKNILDHLTPELRAEIMAEAAASVTIQTGGSDEEEEGVLLG